MTRQTGDQKPGGGNAYQDLKGRPRSFGLRRDPRQWHPLVLGCQEELL